MDKMNVPTHLLQPLSVDTNIIYDLDMSKFPGLDDPHHMYQPALLIATDWSDGALDDKHCVISDEDDVTEDDLFSLIESCHDLLPDAGVVSITEPDTFQTFFDDVITDTLTPGDEFAFFEPTGEMMYTPPSLVEINEFKAPSNHQESSPLSRCVRGQKRRGCSEREFPYSKKSKMADKTSLNLPHRMPVCPTSNVCAMHRDS